jgi:hypothetical protein
MASMVEVYLSEWHQTKSSAFHNILLDPLQSQLSFKIANLTQFSPSTTPQTTSIIFCQTLPSLDALHELRAPMTWIPMWDSLFTYEQDWWNRLPKSLKIVAYSKSIAEYARRANLNVFEIQHFENPDKYPPRNWNTPRTLMYWNRVGLVNKDALFKLCHFLNIERLLFRQKMDPDYPSFLKYQLQDSVRSMAVEYIPDNLPHDEYLNTLQQAHIVVAPRPIEGVGLTFIEALASGCVVLAANESTMNEYIEHGQTGFLLPIQPDNLNHNANVVWQWKKITMSSLPWLKYWLFRIQGKPVDIQPILDMEQIDWLQLQALPLERVGQLARETHQQGYIQWQQKIPQLVSFILN